MRDVCVCVPAVWPPTHLGMHVQNGATPLFMAAQEGHVEVVKLLLGAGANKEASLAVSGPPEAGHHVM